MIRLVFAGPGSNKLVDFTKDWYLFAGDMSALPAISANIEKLPADARGYAVLEIVDELDKQDLPFPEHLDVSWVLNPHPEQENSYLVDAVRRLDWLTGNPAVWVAGESNIVRLLRQYFRDEREN